jgi:CMP-N-acetylneuraminic acid synthetase
MVNDFEVFLPCRKGSKRVINKNTRRFASDGRSLLEIKLGQLLDSQGISKIILSTDDEVAADQAKRLSAAINVVERPPQLAADDTQISDLARYASTLINSEYALWTHVTSPLFGGSGYSRLFEFFSRNFRENLSLVSARRLQSYLFSEQKAPLYLPNRDTHIKWPPTQSLEPIFEVNNASFLFPSSRLALGERTTSLWEFFECSQLESLDVDTEEDWQLAALVFNGAT